MSDLDTNVRQSRPRTPLGLFSASWVFLSLVAFSPVVSYQAWTPKAALLPLLIAAGLPMLLTLLRSPEARSPGTAALAFLLVAAISTAISDHPWIAAFGLYGWGTGLVFCTAIISAWSIGRALDLRARDDIAVAMLAGAGINLLVAIAQRYFDLSSFRLQMVADRSSGLLGNPVNLGALGGAVLALAVVAWGRPKLGAWLVPVAASAGLAQLAGGRIAVGIIVSILGWALVRRGWRTALLASVAVAVGIAVATPIAAADGLATTERLDSVAGSQGVSSRLENWYSARRALAERPLLGSGPGTYLAATGEFRTAKLGQLDGGDNVYADAHNLAVEYTVTTGLAGIATLAAFGFFALRGAGGPMLAVGAVLFVSHLLQPQNVGLTPLMFMAVGAASGQVAARPRARWSRAVWSLGSAVALAATGMLLFADHQLRQSDLDFTLSQSLTAERLLPHWKDPAALVSRNYLFAAIEGGDVEEYFEQAERWRVISAKREPYDAQVWYRLGELQLRRSNTTAAAMSFGRALDVNPTSVFARVGLGHVALLAGDDEQAVRWWKEALPFIKDPSSVAEIEGLIESQSR